MTKTDVYTEVTERIIEALEAGTVPWRKPWSSSAAGTGPVSLRGGKPYRGVNVFLLELTAATAGYTDPRWGTYKAITEAGGQVRRGEKGTRVILWKPVKRDGEAAEAKGPGYLLLRQYTVFNVEQADGIEPLPRVELSQHERHERADAIMAGYDHGPVVIHGASAAVYSPRTDVVRLPDPEAFVTPAAYYLTAFHELVHSTGHESRLKRIEPALFGSDPYAREELVAEMGAAMLAGLAGLPPQTEQSAAYIESWLGALRNDRKLVVQAAAQAQKAADLIVGDTFAPATTDVPEEALAA